MSNFDVSDGTWGWVALTQDERVKLNDYMIQHEGCYSVGIYTSSKSGIGTNVIVECHKCGRASQRDITDYGSW